MSETCSCPGCGRSPTAEVDHAEAAPDAPYSRAANLTPVSRREAITSPR